MNDRVSLCSMRAFAGLVMLMVSGCVGVGVGYDGGGYLGGGYEPYGYEYGGWGGGYRVGPPRGSGPEGGWRGGGHVGRGAPSLPSGGGHGSHGGGGHH